MPGSILAFSLALLIMNRNNPVIVSIFGVHAVEFQCNLDGYSCFMHVRCRYPMAITNIGDLEEVNTTPGRPSPEVLFEEAIESARSYYDNMHVYPYTYLGGYYYRMKHYKEALRAWAEASHVISK